MFRLVSGIVAVALGAAWGRAEERARREEAAARVVEMYMLTVVWCDLLVSLQGQERKKPTVSKE